VQHSLASTPKILVISDSHGTGTFGLTLKDELQKNHYSTSIYAFGGTRPTDWLEGNQLPWGYWEFHNNEELRGEKKPTPTIEELLDKHTPTSVIIVQGTNFIWQDLTPAEIDSITTLASSILYSGAKCLWVGPPDLFLTDPLQQERFAHIKKILLTNLAKPKCKVIKSWEFTHYPENKGDGIHYDSIPQTGSILAAEWSKKSFQKMKKYLH
jgi:hypothetical protein